MTVKFVKVKGPITLENGASLWLPPNVIEGLVNVGIPDVYTQESVQRYPLGAKLEFADGRVFRYGKFGATSTNVPIARMVVNANACPGATGEEDVDGFEGDPYIAAAVGATQVDLEKDTAYAENFFEDGMLSVFPSGHFCEYRICGSELGDGTYCRVYLDEALKTALAADTGITAYKSLFSQVKDCAAEGVAYTSPLGVCLASAFTVNYYGWIQRKGRCIITPTAYFGDNADERLAQMHSDGTIALRTGYDHSIVGYLTQRTVSGYGDLEIWLTLE